MKMPVVMSDGSLAGWPRTAAWIPYPLNGVSICLECARTVLIGSGCVHGEDGKIYCRACWTEFVEDDIALTEGVL